MTTAMRPPPPRNSNPVAETNATAVPEPHILDEPLSSSPGIESPMGPSPPRPQNPEVPEAETSGSYTKEDEPRSNLINSNLTVALAEQCVKKHSSVPYVIPEWSGPPCHKFDLEVLKDGSIIEKFDVCEKGAYMFGRVDLCDFVLEHPTISRFHAVLQFKRNGHAYLYDLGSTHGTFINKRQVEKRIYIELNVGDVIRFGHSSRLYIFQGPPDLMPPEADLNNLRGAKIQQEMLDREASLQRARMEASLADGVSWGMGEDAIEEAEDDGDEVTWQTYKGQLTEKQEKTRENIIKRTQKIAHMKKEIDAIRAKDIAQGGLTQGQQTQIARNELRITQIMEELENLEETLNESIQESIGARAGSRSRGKRKGIAEDDDDEFLSDDDEFYDRAKKPSKQKTNENQLVETADTLLDKRDVIMKEMGDKNELLSIEKNKMASETALKTKDRDALDAYMMGLSSQLVLHKSMQLEKELSALQSELDRIFFLLKIADPSGEAAQKRDLKAQEPKTDEVVTSAAAIKKQSPPEPNKSSGLGKVTNVSTQEESTTDDRVVPIESSNKPEVDRSPPEDDRKGINGSLDKTVVYTVAKPQWLGAVDERVVKEPQQQEVQSTDESDRFVDYKDRQKIVQSANGGAQVDVDSGIESAAPGLIIRKQKETERPGSSDREAFEQSTSSSVEAEIKAEDAVALLLKHKRGYHAEDGEGSFENQEILSGSEPSKDQKQKRPKRVLGPEKPSFLKSNSDFESWLPPEGQSGDGRTSLNERYGY